jgi:hypothetical protein
MNPKHLSITEPHVPHWPANISPPSNQRTPPMNDIKFDPYDPASLRLDQSFCDGTAVTKLLTTVPVRKPNRQDFVRVHPQEAYRLSPAAIIEMKDDREIYLVTPALAPDLVGEMVTATIYTAISRQGVVHLWPVRLPTQDGKHNAWHRSAAEAAEMATRGWIRITSNLSLGAYEVFEAAANIPEPTWPDLSFPDLLKIAFRDRLVDREDHPVILQLRGAI